MSVESLLYGVESTSSKASIKPTRQEERRISDEEQSEHVVQGLLRSYALDTASLLGGDEVLVSRLLQKLNQRSFDPEELDVLRWMFDISFDRSVSSSLFNAILDAHQGKLRQEHLLTFLHPLNLQSLHRIVASTLLYAGRFSDTLVYRHSSHSSWRSLVIDSRHLAQLAIKPLAKMDLSTFNIDSCLVCHHLAIVYFRHEDDEHLQDSPKDDDDDDDDDDETTTATTIRPSSYPRRTARRISASRAYEQSLLSNVEVVAVLAVP